MEEQPFAEDEGLNDGREEYELEGIHEGTIDGVKGNLKDLLKVRQMRENCSDH
jgi:hypothetical protein